MRTWEAVARDCRSASFVNLSFLDEGRVLEKKTLEVSSIGANRIRAIREPIQHFMRDTARCTPARSQTIIRCDSISALVCKGTQTRNEELVTFVQEVLDDRLASHIPGEVKELGIKVHSLFTINKVSSYFTNDQ